jgi:hypothetical protein
VKRVNSATVHAIRKSLVVVSAIFLLGFATSVLLSDAPWQLVFRRYFERWPYFVIALFGVFVGILFEDGLRRRKAKQ